MSENVRHPEWPIQYQNFMTITEAAEYLDIKYPNYIRTLRLKGRIGGVMLQKGSRKMWALDPATIEHYANTRGTFGEGGGGGRQDIRRYTVRVNPTEVSIEDLEEVLQEAFGEGFLSIEKPKYYKPKKKPKTVVEETEWRAATLASLTPSDDDDEDEDEDLDDIDDDGMNL